MEIESFWNNIKPFKKVEKGSNNMIGYGCRSKIRSRYEKRAIRKAYRQIRRYGFDLSEIWSLDYTIQRWLSDNVGGFFRICGCSDDWGEYDLEGNYVDWQKHKNEKGFWETHRSWEETRYNSFYSHLKDFLDNCDDITKKKFADFCCPRLRLLADIMHGWPSGDDFPDFEDWQKEVYLMADALETGTYREHFIKYFFSLWD